MRFAWPFLSALLALALVLPTGVARAQTTSGPSVTGIAGAVARLEPDGVTSADNAGEHPHPGSVPVNAINFEDCEANLILQFSVLISSITSGYALEVWAGAQDCTPLTARQSTTAAVCWPVYQLNLSPNANPAVVSVRVQDIVAQISSSTHSVTYTPVANQPGSLTNDVCQFQQQTGASNLTLYFFFVDSQGNPAGTAQPYPIKVDTRAGDVQGPIGVGVGDTLLVVDVPATTDPDTQEWNVYCDPPPGQESAIQTVPVDAPTNNGQCAAQVPDTGGAAITDGGDGGEAAAAPADAGTAVLDDAGGNPCGVSLNDSGIPAPGGCLSSTVLVPGGTGTSTTTTTTVDEAGNVVVEEAGTTTTTTTTEAGVSITGGLMKWPPLPSQYLCASGSVTSTQINVLGLKDGVYYNIAVAAVDAVGNVGPLSNVPCGEPVPVSDFWSQYWDAGGRAGGGFCSVDGIGTPVARDSSNLFNLGLPAGTSGLAMMMMVASMVAIVRRRRRS